MCKVFECSISCLFFSDESRVAVSVGLFLIVPYGLQVSIFQASSLTVFLVSQDCMSNYPEVYPASKGPSSEDSAELGELNSSKTESLGLGAGDASNAANTEPARSQS